MVRTVFRPHPTREVDSAGAYVATTAHEGAAEAIRSHLEGEHGCRVLGITHSLSNRKTLQEELEAMEGTADVLLCEIKAAGIDVATRWALDKGIEVVYMDNVPVGLEGDDPAKSVIEAAELAEKRFS